MPSKRKTSKRQIKPSDLSGLRDLASLKSLFSVLRPIGTERDRAGNRKLYMDDYCILLLAWLYNPIVDSLRGVEHMSALKSVQKRLGVKRASVASLSESVRIFDPEPLKEIVKELNDQLPTQSKTKLPTLKGVKGKITAVDGSVFRVLTQIANLAWMPVGKDKKKYNCGYRLHTQFEVLRGLPSRIDVTGSNPKGDADERKVLERSLEPGRCYITDRGYEKYALWDAIHDAGSNYVCRTRDNPTYAVLEERELSEEDRQARVVSDQVVQFGGKACRKPPTHPMRLVIIKTKSYNSRSKSHSGAVDSDGFLRLVTDIMDVPAETIAALYSLRWTIEIFFRMIKQLLGCRHLLSTKSEGVEIQFYLALVGCMMILIQTGRMPTKRTYEMVCFYQWGLADDEEFEAHVRKLKADA